MIVKGKLFQILLILCAAVLCPTSCSRPASTATAWAVAGIDATETSAISGVWDDVSSRDALTKARYGGSKGDFSWGESRYHLNVSNIIDLGAKPPFIKLPGLVYAQVVSARSTDGHRYTLQCRSLLQSAQEPINLAIIMNDDGTIYIEGFVGDLEFTRDTWHLFKSSGPGVK